MSQFFILLILAFFYLLYLGYQKLQESLNSAPKLEEANRMIGELQANLEKVNFEFGVVSSSHNDLQRDFEKLRHQKISADVKMGQKSENIMPFLADFPYATEDIRGLFNPIDLIAFTETEVVFIEVKTGAAQLSEKQRRIRDNIKAGRVRFETHRMNEKGVVIK